MGAYNSFRFIGICYGDAKLVSKKTNDYYSKVMLVVKSKIVPSDKQYVPLVFSGKLAERSSIICRNGNLVSVTGEVVSKERFNRTTGETEIQMFFICNDLMLIKKAFKKRLSNQKFSDLVGIFSPDEYEPPRKESGNAKNK